MSIQKLIQESIAGNPLEMKEALVEELKSRISEALAAKMEEDNLDESVSFKKTEYGDHHIHHNGKPVGRITKTSSMGSNGYSVRIGGNTAKHEVGTESSLAAAKDSAKWHLTSSESPVNMKEEVEQIDEIGDTPAGRKALKAVIARAPEKAANSRLRSDVLGRRQFDPDVSSADSERYGHAADKHYKKYQLAVKGAARAVDRLTKEEVELDESEGRQIVDKLKSTGEHEEAGKMAFKHGLGRSYGPHFGMRSSKYSAETAYHKGYDKAEFTSRK
jgi:hypothetical protein